MSGHNKWSTIKHRKAAQDAKKGKVFTKIIKEITIAARQGGGDIDGNHRLRRAVDLAKAANMPADNLQRAIKKGTGELEGVSYEELIYEGVGPSGTLYLLEVVTDNRNRTAAEVRKIFSKHNGQLGATGSAAWAFDQKGQISLPEAAASEEQLFEVAVGAGAEDIECIEGEWTVTTPPTEVDVVREALEAAKIEVSTSTLSWIPKTPKEVGAKDGRVCINLLDALDEHDDVQDAYADFEPPDELLDETS